MVARVRGVTFRKTKGGEYLPVKDDMFKAHTAMLDVAYAINHPTYVEAMSTAGGIADVRRRLRHLHAPSTGSALKAKRTSGGGRGGTA